MTIIWKEFPEINRKVAFNYNYVSPNYPLGCHTGSISGVSAILTRDYLCDNGKNIKVLDVTKEPQITYVKEIYSGYFSPPNDELYKVIEYIHKIKLKFTDICQGAYESIVDKCSHVPLWVMSDVINYDAPARDEFSVQNGIKIIGRTADFAQYLIDNKIGYILASPIIQNPNHRQKKKYSLNRGWFWIPPKHLQRSINVSEEFGIEGFPNKDKWLNVVGKDLGISSSNNSENILKQVFNDGVFPEDKRFKRSKEVINEA